MSRNLKRNMIKIYATKEFDWIGCRITRKNPITFHHIFKKVYGKWVRDQDNGALLTHTSHCFLHKLEHYDRELYNEINEVLLELNKTKHPPTAEHYTKVKKLLKKGEPYV